MNLTDDLHLIMTEFLQPLGEAAVASLRITAGDCWSVGIRCHSSAWPDLLIRSVTAADVPTLERFGAQLGPHSRSLFYPYPWHDAAALHTALETAIARSVNRINATYVIESGGGGVVGHFFLHDTCAAPAARQQGICMPVLGVAVADAWQGRRLGTLGVRLLQAISPHFGADGIELTTLSNNLAGQHVYRCCGFEDTGVIAPPADANGMASSISELQMLYVIRPGKRAAMEIWLRAKRGKSTTAGEASEGSIR